MYASIDKGMQVLSYFFPLAGSVRQVPWFRH
jgi:hypothetical protein